MGNRSVFSLFMDGRLWVLLIPAILVLATDLPVLMTLLYSMSAILVVVAVSHVTRTVLFPYLDLGCIASRASEGPTGAGLVFLGVCLVVAFTILSTVIWIGR